MVTVFLQCLLHSPVLTFANQNLKLSNGANGQRTMQLPLSRSFDRAVIMMMIADMIAAAQRPPARRSEAALRLDQLWRFVSLSEADRVGTFTSRLPGCTRCNAGQYR